MGKENTKTKILKTASRLFQKQGYHATGLNQIIKESGCPKGSLYYYFPEGKEQLAVEAVELVKQMTFEGLDALFAQHEDVIDAIDQFFKDGTNFDPTVEHDGLPLALITLETALMSENLRHACKEVYDLLVKKFADKFITCNWPKNIAEDLAYFIITMAEGSLIFAFTHLSNEPLKTTHRIIVDTMKAKQREVFGHDK